MKIRVLSCDGGGVRGIIPAVVLEYIENQIIEITKNPKARLSDFLDFGAGTSTGSIISAMVMTPDECGRPAYKMSDVVQGYFNLAEVVFKKNLWRDIKTVWGIFGPRYSTKNINNELLKKFDHWRLEDLLLPCAFTGYDIHKRTPNIYTNRDDKEKYGRYFLKDVVRGSTAIPSQFEPAYFRDGVDVNTIVDGGVFANNPSMVAYVEVTKTNELLAAHKVINPNNMMFLSFGTGTSSLTEYPYRKAKRWGAAKWFFPILNILLQGVGDVTTYEMARLFEAYGAGENFIRISPPIVLGNSNGKDASEENMKNLHQDGVNYVTANKTMLNEIAAELVKQDTNYKTLLF
jgi:hypothetical protein